MIIKAVAFLGWARFGLTLDIIVVSTISWEKFWEKSRFNVKFSDSVNHPTKIRNYRLISEAYLICFGLILWIHFCFWGLRSKSVKIASQHAKTVARRLLNPNLHHFSLVLRRSGEDKASILELYLRVQATF